MSSVTSRPMNPDAAASRPDPVAAELPAIAPTGAARPVSDIDPNSHSLGELAQAKVRFGINILFILSGLLAYRHDPSIGLAWVWTTFSVCLVSALSLYLWARLLGKTLRDPRWRIGQRIASIIVDNLAVTWLLFFGGQALAGAYGVYLWITIGYGMRFGLLYLYGNLAASILGYLLVTQFSPFWKSNPSLSIGLGIALLVVPLYAAYLIKRLRTAVADAREAYAAKSDFVAKMSHELRTPLHGIISVADLLGRTQATPQQKEMIRIVSVSSNTLLDLINRILDISKFEDGTFAIQREPMNLHTVINDTLTIIWPQARSKGLRLEFYIDPAIPPDVVGSPRQLQEVLINLCGNAVKFTDEGSVLLKVESAPAASDKVGVHFEIVDTGPGLTKDQLEKIFSPFYQADTGVTRKHGGTGLGTAIARELVRLMGGRISVASEPGQGAVFSIELGFDRLAHPVESPRPAAIDVAVLAGDADFNLLERQLPMLGAVVTRISLNDPGKFRLLSPPALIVADVEQWTGTASELRHLLSRQTDEVLVPVCGFGPDASRAYAVQRGFNSFVALPDAVSRFKEVLGIAHALRKDYATQAVVNDSPGRVRVLVAEDNLTNQTIARMALTEGGFDCTIVADGEEALIELTEGEYAVALLDMHMPVMDGMEVARLYNFSEIDPQRRIPLIMVTADSRPEIVADAELAGVTRFLTKPLKPSAMIEAINNVLSEHGVRAVVEPMYRPEPVAADATDVVPELIDESIVQELLGYMEGEDRAVFFSEFSEDARSYIRSLEHTATEPELEKVRNDMHALCGAARTVGALKLAAYARRIEYMPGREIANSDARIRTELSALVQDSEEALRTLAGIV